MLRFCCWWITPRPCSTAYWALQLGSAPHRGAPVAQAQRGAASVDPAEITRLLGGGVAAPGMAVAPVATLASRFTLVGVAAQATSGGGAAVISVDGKPARPFRVGSFLDQGILLQSVQGRRAVLAALPDGPPLAVLELPAPPPMLMPAPLQRR